ncbi:MAG: apolipoprotein N-acyltransferase [Spirochaetales bacterium]
MKAPLLALLSAAAFASAIPNEFLAFGSPTLGLIALVPLYSAFRIAPDMTTAIRAGAVFGAVSTMLSNYWLANFGEFSAWTLGGPTVGYLAYNMLLATVLYTLMRLPSHVRPLSFALAWTGYEFLKSVGYLGYPWGLAAYSFGDVVPAMQIADITGVYGLTFIVVYINAAIAEVVLLPQIASAGSRRRRFSSTPLRHLALAAALLLLNFGYGWNRLSKPPVPDDIMRVALIQQNTDSWQRGNLSNTLTTLQRLSTEALETREHDLLVWSESSISVPYQQYRTGYLDRTPSSQPLTEFIAQIDTPLMTGSPYQPSDGTGSAWNAALLLEPGSGDIIERYGKRQLVPFAEHIPLSQTRAVRRFFRDVVGLQAVWSPGDASVLFELPTRNGTVAGAAPICFEDAFAPIIREFTRDGADVMVNLTNNAWSRTDSAQYQHFVAARFRSIESRRTLIRSTNAGLTTVVDIDGTMVDQLPMFEAAFLSVDAPIYTSGGLTVYHIVGDLFAYFALASTAGSIATVGLGLRHRKKT